MMEINNIDFVARAGPNMIISTQNLGLFMNLDRNDHVGTSSCHKISIIDFRHFFRPPPLGPEFWQI